MACQPVPPHASRVDEGGRTSDVSWDGMGCDMRALFEIVVYRVDFETWSAESERQITRYVDRIIGEDADEGWDRDEVERRVASADIRSWRYNEAVGWIRLRRAGTGRIEAHFHPVTSPLGDSTQGRHFQPDFDRLDEPSQTRQLFEIRLESGDSSCSFAARLRHDLVDTTRPRGILFRRTIDLECFDAIASSVDWHSVLS